MERINMWVARIFGWGAGLSMAAVFLIIFVNSVRRYTIGQSVQWGEELPVYLAAYGVMFGISMAYMQDKHIRFTILVDFLSARRKMLAYAAGDVVVLVTGILLVMSGIAFLERRGGTMSSGMFGASRWIAETTGIEAMTALSTLGVYQFSLVLGGCMLGLAATLKFIERISELRGN